MRDGTLPEQVFHIRHSQRNVCLLFVVCGEPKQLRGGIKSGRISGIIYEVLRSYINIPLELVTGRPALR